MRKRVLFIVTMMVASLAGTVQAATLYGWDVGWHHMATITGGTAVSYPGVAIDDLDYAVITRANVSFSTINFLTGAPESPGSPPAPLYSDFTWAGIVGDQGQHYFDGLIRGAGYTDAVPGFPLEAANHGAANATGPYEWLLNNYSGTTLMNSLIRGTGSSTTFQYDTGGNLTGFTIDLTSDGTWHWYGNDPDSPMSGWIKDYDFNGLTTWDAISALDPELGAYRNHYMTGNFRIVGTFGPNGIDADLQYEVAAVPVPAAAPLGLVGMGLIAFLRRRKKNIAA